jgi:hypothetical protein
VNTAAAKAPEKAVSAFEYGSDMRRRAKDLEATHFGDQQLFWHGGRSR